MSDMKLRVLQDVYKNNSGERVYAGYVLQFNLVTVNKNVWEDVPVVLRNIDEPEPNIDTDPVRWAGMKLSKILFWR